MFSLTYVFVYAPCVCKSLWRPKKASDLSELESQAGVNHPTWMLGTNSGPLQEQ